MILEFFIVSLVGMYLFMLTHKRDGGSEAKYQLYHNSNVTRNRNVIRNCNIISLKCYFFNKYLLFNGLFTLCHVEDCLNRQLLFVLV